MANELITGIGIAGAGAAANTIAGETAQRRQKELMSIQLKNQQQLNKQGAALQMDMWNKTNYAAQVKHMKEAGLSAGLMYGKGGAGGATTGSQSGGSAASGNAPQRAQMGIEGLMAGHQMELMKAQARKLNAEANNEENGRKNKLEAEFKDIMARADYTEELRKTQVNKTEQARYEAAIQKLNKKWMEDYKLTAMDSNNVKTMLRLANEVGNMVPTDEQVQQAYLTLKNNEPSNSEQKRLSKMRGLNGETIRD